MRAKLKPVITSANQSILVKNDRLKEFYAPHHYHPEYEIIYIKKSHGIRVIGNNIDNYSAGEVVILGPGLPHYHEVGDVGSSDETPIETIAVLFPESIIQSFKTIPEYANLERTLENTAYGMEIVGESRRMIQEEMKLMTVEPGFNNLSSLMNIFNILIQGTSDCQLLSSVTYSNKKIYNEKTTIVLDYIAQHFLDDIRQTEVADQINLSQTAFCNFFKAQTGITFSNYINMLRISKACELLLTTPKNIAEIAYEVGFENLAYFNRKFRSIRSLTPREFRRSVK